MQARAVSALHGPAGRAFQFTALHMAVMSQRVDIAKYLPAEGADINAKFEPHGDSSFELAERSTSKGGQEVYQLLTIDVGAYLPSYQLVTIYFLKDLLSGAKQRK